MEKIVFEDLPSTDTPINASNLNTLQDNVESAFKNEYSESQTDGYTCDYLNKLHTYSSQEKRVGTWTNGKPLYNKTIEFANFVKNDIVNLGIENIDEIMVDETHSFATRSDGFRVDNYYLNPNDFFTMLVNQTSFYAAWGTTDLTFPKITLTVEYTKTTDTAE